MDYSYLNSPLITDTQENLDADDAKARRRRKEVNPNIPVAAGAAGTVLGDAARKAVWSDLNKTMAKEFHDIRTNPELAARQYDQMVRTYDKFLNKTGNPVEVFVDMPGTNQWAAGQLPNGDDVVWYDSTAPHAAVMAHELGHVNMNHANPILDPLAGLQTSGLGRWSGENAGTIGAVSSALGALLGRKIGTGLQGQLIGTGLGGVVGTLGGSGQFAYELGGASGRALGYLPEDYDQADAAGDLLRAGMTYGMGGPGAAAIGALGAGSAAALAMHPGVRRFAGQYFLPA